MVNIGEKLKEIRINNRLTQQEMADKLGVSKAAISLIETGTNKPRIELIQKIAKMFSVSLNELINDKQALIVKEPQSGYGGGVPVYNIDFTAGDITQFSDEPSRIIGRIDLNGFRKCVAFVQIKGDSMYPKFVAGDIVGIEPMLDFKIIEYGQPFGIETKNGQRLIKIIRKGKDNNHLILRSENKDYDDIDIHRSDIDKLHKVHGPVRDQWQ